MRKFLFISLILSSVSVNPLKSQVWIDFGVKGGLGASFLMNANVWNDRASVHKLTGANSYGAKFGLNLGMKSELTVDYMFSKYAQNMQINNDDGIFEMQFGIRSTEVPILYRLNGDEGSYLEVGGAFGQVRGAFESGDLSSPVAPINYYERNYKSAVFGFGSYVLGAENVYLAMGLRFSYVFTDVISVEGGKNTTNYYPTQNNYAPSPAFLEYKPTTPFSALFMIEINYDLGYLARAACGRTAIMLF